VRLTPSDTEAQLREVVAGVLARHLPSEFRPTDANGRHDVGVKLSDELAGLGLVAVRAPLEFGGGGSDLLHLGVVLGELGRRCAPGPYLSLVSAVEVLLATAEPWADTLLGEISRTGTKAVAGPAGPTPTPVTVDSASAVSGQLLCEWADQADVLLVTAPVDDGWAVLAVDPTSKGIATRPVETIDDVEVVKVELRSVVALERGSWRGEADPTSALVPLRLAEMIGLSEEMMRMTIEHVTSRRQFGATLASRQAVQQRCADAQTALVGARLAVAESLWKRSRGLPVTRSTAIAAYLTGRAAELVATTASLLHGGVGYIVDHPLPGYFLRAKGQRLRLGSLPGQLDRVAAATFGTGATRWAFPDFPVVS
jgi:alkylation response protein AidB-like acyl-CoA dehydrogenase